MHCLPPLRYRCSQSCYGSVGWLYACTPSHRYIVVEQGDWAPRSGRVVAGVTPNTVRGFDDAPPYTYNITGSAGGVALAGAVVGAAGVNVATSPGWGYLVGKGYLDSGLLQVHAACILSGRPTTPACHAVLLLW